MKRFLVTCSRDVLVLVVLTLVAGAITKVAHPAAPAWYLQPEADPYAISRADVQSRWHDDVLWIDARAQEVYDQGHQPGALRLPPDEWQQLLPDLFEQITSASKPIVVYCDGQKCGKSKEVSERLRAIGVADVYHLIGGWSALSAAPRP
jgi:rhodanese-related sulfurtransferase